MGGNKTGHKWGNGYGQKKVIIEGRKNPDFWECDPPKNKKDDTDNHGDGQVVCQGFRDCGPADSPSLFQNDVMGRQKDRRDDQANMEDKKEDSHTWFGTPAACSKWKQPKENGSQCPFDAIGYVDPISHPIHLPAKASDVADHTDNDPNEKNAE